jgi:hypothetical protein
MIQKGVTVPITMHNLTMCDCGGGWMGRLAMVNVDTLDYFVSGTQVPRYEPDDDGSDDTEEIAWGRSMKNPDMKNPNW